MDAVQLGHPDQRVVRRGPRALLPRRDRPSRHGELSRGGRLRHAGRFPRPLEARRLVQVMFGHRCNTYRHYTIDKRQFHRYHVPHGWGYYTYWYLDMPKTKTTRPRSRVVMSLHMPPDTHRQLSKAARLSDVSVAAFVREAALTAAQRAIEAKTEAPPA